MMFSSLASGLTAALTMASVANAALPTITTNANHFYTSDGNQFYVKGVAYQLTPADPLVDVAQCTRDANLMATLKANAIRVYHVDPTQNHDACMAAFANVGIYLFLDLDTFTSAIVQTAPTWTAAMASAFEAVMDAFHGYSNLAGFFIGNEIISTGEFSDAAPYIKAATADMKAYRNAKGYRNIPIGYSHADISSLRPNLQNYLACGTNSSQMIDFFGLNAYEWCGDANYQTSGYSILNSQVTTYPIPIFFSETGCNAPDPRTFQDQVAIFGSQMSPYWSGAIIYEWIQEDNHYGLITYGGGNTDSTNSALPAGGISYSGIPTPVQPDFNNLMTVWAGVNPSSTPIAAVVTSAALSCPAYTASLWEVSGAVPLPTLGAAVVGAGSGSTSAAATASTSRSGSSSAAATTSHTTSSAVAATTTVVTSTAAAASASASHTGGASGQKEIAGVFVGLTSVFLGFIFWL